MYLTNSENHKVVSYIRRILKDQVRSADMDSRLTRFIKAEGLLKEHEWPGHHIVLTERGREFLREQREGEI